MNPADRQTIQVIVKHYPAVVPFLDARARWVVGSFEPEEYKTYEYFLSTLSRMITNVYDGNMGGDFIDVMANLISGQLTQAFRQAWKDEEGKGDLPDYLSGPLEDIILSEYDHVDQLYRDIVDARMDKTPIDPLLVRAAMWANRWNDAYNQAVALITEENGGNLIWQYGEAEHCQECEALNGIVARASEWSQLGVHPQQPPNELITCGGWNCQCSLEPTDKRRSPKAYETIMNIVGK